jgi:hypothetical protein
LVGSAIARCYDLLKQYIEQFETGVSVDPSVMIFSLRTAIRSSVVGYDGSSLGLYPVRDDEMVFGAHSIDVKRFIEAVLESFAPEIATPLLQANT